MTILRIFGFNMTLYRRAVNQLINYIERGPNYKSDEGDMKTPLQSRTFYRQLESGKVRLLIISNLINKQ